MNISAPVRSLLCATVALVMVGGCSSHAQLTSLQQRVTKLERQRRALRDTYKRDQKRLERLRQDIEASSRYLRRNGARMNARVDDLEDALRLSRGASDVLRHRVESIAKALRTEQELMQALGRKHQTLVADLRDRAGISVLALPRELPEHADKWIELANHKFAWGEVRASEAIARECRKRFQGTEQAAKCGMIVGKIAYEEHRFNDAVSVFRAVHDALDGKALDIVAEALQSISRTFEAQGKCAQSKQVLVYVKGLMKANDTAKQATELLASLGKRCTEGQVQLPEPSSGSLKRAHQAAELAKAKTAKEAEIEQDKAAQRIKEQEQKKIQEARIARDKRAAAEAKVEAQRIQKDQLSKNATQPRVASETVKSQSKSSKSTSAATKDKGATKGAKASKQSKPASQSKPLKDK
ncbi:MAG TPA: hypothetical protein DCQ06_07250 [Myxococcales bacterium]|nr:hypothetical protein [Myxococcales bacterium]HAN31377.1 hypothetical protein [Myxococcales bacterium]